jgi:hypothetical protein
MPEGNPLNSAFEPDMNKNNNLKPRDGYPIIHYHGSDTQVLIGDNVEFKLGLFFLERLAEG